MSLDIVDVRDGRGKPARLLTLLSVGMTLIILVSLPFHAGCITVTLLFVLCVLPLAFLFLYIGWAILVSGSLHSPQEEIDAVPKISDESNCTIIIAVRDEPIQRLRKVCSEVCRYTPRDVKVLICDNGSSSIFAKQYQELSNERIRIIHEPLSPLRQFGAQLHAARESKTKWVAVLDADFILQGPWLNYAIKQMLKSGAQAIGYPNISEKKQSVTSRWSNSVLRFEFGVENPVRLRHNAHTLSGTMIVTLREHFIQYYSEISSARFTQDFDFGLWLHQKNIPFTVAYQCFGLGLAPYSSYDFAVQQIKWSDDLLLYLDRVLRNGFYTSIQRHIHFVFHASKHLLGQMIILAALGTYYATDLLVALIVYLAAGGTYFLVLYERGELLLRDAWYSLTYPALSMFALLARILQPLGFGKYFKKRTKRIVEIRN